MAADAAPVPFNLPSLMGMRPRCWSHPHQAELNASAIHRELQALNFYSLDGRDPYSQLLYTSDLPHRNDGRLTDY